MRGLIVGVCLLVVTSHLGANSMSGDLQAYINSDKLKIEELIEKGSCGEAVNMSQYSLKRVSNEFKGETSLTQAKSIYYGMMHEAYANKNSMCETTNNKLALSYLVMQVNSSGENYDQLGDVYYFGKYGEKIDSVKALKYYMKEYAKDNQKRGGHLYNTAQILIEMNRQDKAAVFLQKNFDCIKSQKLLQEIEEGQGCKENLKDNS